MSTESWGDHLAHLGFVGIVVCFFLAAGWNVPDAGWWMLGFGALTALGVAL